MTTATEQHATSSKLLMGQLAPALKVNTLEHGWWNLMDQSPKTYTMVVFYRGVHCPICAQHLAELDQKLSQFHQLGVNAIAISGDSLDKAQQLKSTASISHLPIGYGLQPADMRRWGLYLSQGHFEQEPSLFSEPAVFLIKADGHLYFSNVGTHPFSRLSWDFLLTGLDYVIANDYPFRGTL